MNLKKLIALLMALLMLLSMAAVAEDVEEEEDDQPMLFGLFSNSSMYHVTINGLKPGHTFAAYQIFTGTLAADGTLADIDWGNGVDGTSLLEALKSDADIGSKFTACTSAPSVAAVLSDFGDNSDDLYNFADVVEEHLNREDATYSYADDTFYTIAGLPAGYYLIKDVGDIPAGSAASRYILRVTENVEITAKADAPHALKQIDGDLDDDPNTTGLVSVNNAAVGDVVPYVITSKVPDMDGYETYWFIVNDTMDGGLTYNKDLKVFIDGTELVNTDSKQYYTVTPAADTELVAGTNTNITVVFHDFIQHKAQAGKTITLTYSATLNSTAKVGNEPNTNTVSLTYSNNPNVTYEGDQPTGPNDSTPTGTTPSSTVNTYTTAVTLHKYYLDTQNAKQALSGAQFELTGTMVKDVYIKGVHFVLDDAGTWYELKSGTYTQTVPTDSNSVAYADTTLKYTREAYHSVDTMTDAYKVTGWVNEQGDLVFSGLQEGSYTLTEIVAPEGFNKLTSPINFTVTFSGDDASSEKIWSIDNLSFTEQQTNESFNGTFRIEIENKKGSVLPSTGGMGTTVLYIAGGIMVLAAFVLIVSKKRAAAE